MMIVIDHANLLESARSFGAARPDLRALVRRLVDRRDRALLRAATVFAGVPVRIPRRWQREYDELRTSGFGVRTVPGKRGRDGRWRLDVDVALAVDTLDAVAADPVTEIVLVSGDADFVPLVRSLQRRGVHVCIASVEANLARVLRRTASSLVILDPWLRGRRPAAGVAPA
jgi:uncharacterized LabA/DUF88 family protein